MNVCAVVLAAGAGRRLGGRAKATLPTPEGRTFLEAIAATAAAAGIEGVLVVAAEPHLGPTRDEAARLGLEVAVNPAPERGMASSVACGFGVVAGRDGVAAGALLWPVDHPYVRVETVAALLSHLEEGVAVVPTWGGRGGHPALFGRLLWPELATCDGAPAGPARSFGPIRAGSFASTSTTRPW